MSINTDELGEKVVRVVKTIFDPEIPVDIYELGLIYDVIYKNIINCLLYTSDAADE